MAWTSKQIVFSHNLYPKSWTSEITVNIDIIHTHKRTKIGQLNFASDRIESMKNIINWTLPSVQYTATVTLMQVLR